MVELVARAVLGQLGVRVKSKDHLKRAVYHKGGTREVFDRPIVTDGEVAHHRPDIVVFQRNKVTLIEVAVAWDPTVGVREHEKRIPPYYFNRSCIIFEQHLACHTIRVLVRWQCQVCQYDHPVQHLDKKGSGTAKA